MPLIFIGYRFSGSDETDLIGIFLLEVLNEIRAGAA
jgi:hypothetical protein